MPRKRPAIDDFLRTQGSREEMIEGPSGVEHVAHGLCLRVVDLPLFRRSERGGLLQTLRVLAWAGSDAGDVTFSVSEGRRVLDRTTARIDKGRTLVHLFVPEVREARTFTLEVANGGGETSRTAVEVRPQRKWSVFVIHHSHLDIGYTDPQGSVLQHHLQYLDSVLDLASATDDWPDDARFRWNVEVTWPLMHWLKVRPEADRREFVERVRQGRVEVCALPFSMHTEAYSMDELARQRLHGGELRRPGCGLRDGGGRASRLPGRPRTATLPVREERLRVDGPPPRRRGHEEAVPPRPAPHPRPERYRGQRRARHRPGGDRARVE